MKGYIYTMYSGADPGRGWRMTDPIFGVVPTLGACVPNIRRLVEKGDAVFAISGRVSGERQYVVGGFRVAEKIHALAAYQRFPENRLRKHADGTVSGNVIVDANSEHHFLDTHDAFERRIDNYLVGRDPIVLMDGESVERGRQQTLAVLSEIFAKPGKTVAEVVGRWRKLDEKQVLEVEGWLLQLCRDRRAG